MDYRTAMELCEKFIEEHAGETVTARSLADMTGYSLYHFCHVFRAYFDMPVGEYTRRRTLHRAASDILAGKPITEAAFDAGFNTSAGFSKAFRKQFGMSATQYRHQNMRRSSDHMKPKFEKKEAFSAIGYHISPPDGHKVDILDSGAYWIGANFHDRPKYPTDSAIEGEVGAWTHPDEVAGDLQYFFGYISNAVNVPDGFVKLDVPAAEYAVFSVLPAADGGEGLAMEIRRVWKYIFKEWLDSSQYRFDESKVCFEFYRGENTWVYIPVKMKA